MIPSINQAQIKKIKTLQRAAGMEEEDYRAMLWNLAKVGSCTALKGVQVDLVIRHLKRCAGQGKAWGKKAKGEKGGKGLTQTVNQQPLRATAQQWHIMRGLWQQVSVFPPGEQREQALKKWLRNRFHVGAPEWMTLGQAQKAIEGLKQMAARGRPA